MVDCGENTFIVCIYIFADSICLRRPVHYLCGRNLAYSMIKLIIANDYCPPWRYDAEFVKVLILPRLYHGWFSRVPIRLTINTTEVNGSLETKLFLKDSHPEFTSSYLLNPWAIVYNNHSSETQSSATFIIDPCFYPLQVT